MATNPSWLSDIVHAPRLNGSGFDLRGRTQNTALAAGVSTAEVDIWWWAGALAAVNTYYGAEQDGIYIRLCSTVNCHIGFGNTGMNAATANDWPMFANTPQEFVVVPSVFGTNGPAGTATTSQDVTRFFRAFNPGGVAGTLYWYIG